MFANIDRFTPERQALLKRLLPQGVPTLWCPLLTHYRPEGGLDTERMGHHLDALRGTVQGLLVPGSTGDGWQLTEAEVRELLTFLLPQARARGMAVLIGVLKTDTPAMLASLSDTSAWLRRLTGATTDEAALQASGVCGYTVCAPAGEALSQDDIRMALDEVLNTGLPMALYQLPQVTKNEMSPVTVTWLAGRHPNFLFFKDTSGADRVAQAGVREVFLVRGAEGNYSGHLAQAGGAYDGFLLSTANGFGPQLSQVISDLSNDQAARAEATSRRMASVVDTVFTEAAALPFGNAFTNANKAIDHFMAHGPGAPQSASPRLHSGQRLPMPLLATHLAGTAPRGPDARARLPGLISRLSQPRPLPPFTPYSPCP